VRKILEYILELTNNRFGCIIALYTEEMELQMKVYLLIRESGDSLASQVIVAFKTFEKALAERDHYRSRDSEDHYFIQEVEVE